MSEDRRINAVTVYCSSSNSIHPEYARMASAIGRMVGESGRSLVYGGGSVGMMGHAARACREAGGRVVGVITETLRDAEQMDPDNDEIIVVRTMRERKAIMEARGDCFVILPGGLGTLEEFFEILVGRILSEHGKPLALVNMEDPDDRGSGFFDPLLALFDHMIASRFAKPGVLTMFSLTPTADALMAQIDTWERDGVASVDTRTLVPSGPNK
ncbi:MAG: TIGR00730 family Rossman fold protein [Phycisphaerales bacterium]|nr:TIGR00730 family Rossman fold protein [Phycisphaerales bacterium]